MGKESTMAYTYLMHVLEIGQIEKNGSSPVKFTFDHISFKQSRIV